MFFKKSIDKKNTKIKVDIIHKTNEEYISVTYGCIRFIGSYRFVSSSLAKLVKTLVDNSHKTLKDLNEETVDIEILYNVNEINILLKEDRYKIDSLKVLRKDYPDKNKKSEEALLNYMGKMLSKFENRIS